MSDQDRAFLLRAVELARHHMERGAGGPFGAVIVRDGLVIAEGWNRVTSDQDPTAHAEVVAIRQAAQAIGSFSLVGATLYTSCEPCPMCLGAIYWARLDRLVFAGTKHDAANAGFDDAFIYHEIDKPIAERRVASLHLPLAEVHELFNAWVRKEDRLPY